MSKKRTLRRSLELRRALVEHAEVLRLELVSYKRVDRTTVSGAFRAMHELDDRFVRTGEMMGEAVDKLTGVRITARRRID